MKHVENPAKGAEFTPRVVKARQWENGDQWFLTKPRHAYTEAYEGRETEVYLPDGTWIGTVSKYTGSLDRKIVGTRLRHPGKRRTLWSYQTPGDSRPMYGQVSRADCIRDLARHHTYRNRK